MVISAEGVGGGDALFLKLLFKKKAHQNFNKKNLFLSFKI
jgi:hypothetical protein